MEEPPECSWLFSGWFWGGNRGNLGQGCFPTVGIKHSFSPKTILSDSTETQTAGNEKTPQGARMEFSERLKMEILDSCCWGSPSPFLDFLGEKWHFWDRNLDFGGNRRGKSWGWVSEPRLGWREGRWGSQGWWLCPHAGLIHIWKLFGCRQIVSSTSYYADSYLIY